LRDVWRIGSHASFRFGRGRIKVLKMLTKKLRKKCRSPATKGLCFLKEQ